MSDTNSSDQKLCGAESELRSDGMTGNVLSSHSEDLSCGRKVHYHIIIYYGLKHPATEHQATVTT